MIDEQTNRCDSKKANFVVPWAGALKMCCEEHAHQFEVLGNVIGSPVEVRRIKTKEKCYMVKPMTTHPITQ